MHVADAPRRLHVGRWVMVGLAIAFLALLAYGLMSKGTDDRIDEALASGRAAKPPSFSLEVLQPGRLPARLERRVGPALADDRLSLAELRGVPVVLNMWASWCTPCKEESAELQAGWRAQGPRGMLFLGLDIQDVRDQAEKFIREEGTTYPSVREPERDVSDDFGATGIPETYFIDKRGLVVAHARGPVTANALRAGMRAAATGQVTLIR
jgi:thiol-disulfide isomerase/thioredoxin